MSLVGDNICDIFKLPQAEMIVFLLPSIKKLLGVF